MNHTAPRLLTVWLVAFAVLVTPAQSQQVSSPAQVEAVLSVGMTVSDMDRAVDFYSRVLTFDPISDIEVAGPDYEQLSGVFGMRARIVIMQLGQERIELTEYLTPQGRPIPPDSRSNDRWFQHIAIIVSDMDRAYARLREHRVRHASTGPQLLPEWNPNAGGISAFYFKDPDNHVLEILAFPPDKGDPRWHQPSTRLFLGIDHTAIVVSDTEASLRFYRDLLGFTVAGHSENYGAEQAHLNNVEDAHLRITGLRVPQGPAIEFLEYLNTRDGRAYPADSRPTDLWHWETTLRVSDPDGAAARFAGQYPFTARGVVRSATAGFGLGFGVRDPDGHVMRLVQR